ncbi:MAG: hypothetical protein CK528_11610 [Alcaligenaceae bacterium]|nr:MAG: hypothetical protein CK528_11610 [Alcaligenaceae bacterium]
MSKEMSFPLVGCAGSDHREAAQYHQRWFVVDAHGSWLSAVQCPGLAAVSTDIRMGYLVLRAPGMLRMDIPMDVIEDDDSVRKTTQVADQTVDVIDEGEVAATWFSHVTGQPSRLVKVHPEAKLVLWPGNA